MKSHPNDVLNAEFAFLVLMMVTGIYVDRAVLRKAWSSSDRRQLELQRAIAPLRDVLLALVSTAAASRIGALITPDVSLRASITLTTIAATVYLISLGLPVRCRAQLEAARGYHDRLPGGPNYKPQGQIPTSRRGPRGSDRAVKAAVARGIDNQLKRPAGASRTALPIFTLIAVVHLATVIAVNSTWGGLTGGTTLLALGAAVLALIVATDLLRGRTRTLTGLRPRDWRSKAWRDTSAWQAADPELRCRLDKRPDALPARIPTVPVLALFTLPALPVCVTFVSFGVQPLSVSAVLGCVASWLLTAMFARRRILCSRFLTRWEDRLQNCTLLLIRIASLTKHLYATIRFLYMAGLMVGITAVATATAVPQRMFPTGLGELLASGGLVLTALALMLSIHSEMFRPRRLTYIRGEEILKYVDDPFVAQLVKTIGVVGKLLELLHP